MAFILWMATYIIIFLAVIGSIAAWINTRKILKDLAEIKKELGLKEPEKPATFLEQSLNSENSENKV